MALRPQRILPVRSVRSVTSIKALISSAAFRGIQRLPWLDRHLAAVWRNSATEHTELRGRPRKLQFLIFLSVAIHGLQREPVAGLDEQRVVGMRAEQVAIVAREVERAGIDIVLGPTLLPDDKQR
jgi:hypothetical protein